MVSFIDPIQMNEYIMYLKKSDIKILWQVGVDISNFSLEYCDNNPVFPRFRFSYSNNCGQLIFNVILNQEGEVLSISFCE